MTLIVGLRCADGLVISADSQETIGEYRMSVQKIEPSPMGAYLVTVVGSGLGELIDGFIECLRERLSTITDSDLNVFKKIFEAELARYGKDEVALSSVPRKYRHLSFLVSAHAAETYELWLTKGGKLKRVTDHCMLGWDEPLYSTILSRLYRPEMSVAQGVLASAYVLAIAEATSNSVRGPMTVAIINKHGAWIEGSGYVHDMTQRLRAFEERINSLLLASADTGLFLTQYQNILDGFTQEAMRLHKEQLVQSLRIFLSDPTLWRFVNSPYNRIPPALSLAIASGDLDDILSKAEKEDIVIKMSEAAKANLNLPEEAQQPPEWTKRDPSSSTPPPESPAGSDES